MSVTGTSTVVFAVINWLGVTVGKITCAITTVEVALTGTLIGTLVPISVPVTVPVDCARLSVTGRKAEVENGVAA